MATATRTRPWMARRGWRGEGWWGLVEYARHAWFSEIVASCADVRGWSRRWLVVWLLDSFPRDMEHVHGHPFEHIVAKRLPHMQRIGL